MKIQCNVCETAEAVVLCCGDEAALCRNCDEKVHAANNLASKDQRRPKCDICQEHGVIGSKRMFVPEPQPIDLEAETSANVQTGTSNLEVNMHKLFRADPLRRPPGRKAHKKSSSSDAATSSRSNSSAKSEAYESIKMSALAQIEAIHTIKEISKKKLAFKALKFLTFQKKHTKKEKELLRNARAYMVEEYGPMFLPRQTDPNDEAEDEESESE